MEDMIVLRTNEQEWLTIREAAALIGVCPQYIYRLIVQQRIVSQRASPRCWLVSRASLQAYRPTRKGYPRRGSAPC